MKAKKVREQCPKNLPETYRTAQALGAKNAIAVATAIATLLLSIPCYATSWDTGKSAEAALNAQNVVKNFMANHAISRWANWSSASSSAASWNASGGDKIVGGVEIGHSDPITSTTVALINGDSLCTASLIASDIAVTAAHCVDGGDPSQMAIVFATDLNDPSSGTAAPVIDTTTNSRWQGEASSGKDQGDIALVRFDGGLPSGYTTATIISSRTKLVKNQVITLAGYGITNADTQDGAGVLRKTNVKIADPNFARTEILFDQTDGHGACHGDSGGPAFVRQGSKLVLLGVTNRGYPDNAPDDCLHQSVYTKVTAYSSWIKTASQRLRAE